MWGNWDFITGRRTFILHRQWYQAYLIHKIRTWMYQTKHSTHTWICITTSDNGKRTIESSSSDHRSNVTHNHWYKERLAEGCKVGERERGRRRQSQAAFTYIESKVLCPVRGLRGRPSFPFCTPRAGNGWITRSRASQDNPSINQLTSISTDRVYCFVTEQTPCPVLSPSTINVHRSIRKTENQNLG